MSIDYSLLPLSKIRVGQPLPQSRACEGCGRLFIPLKKASTRGTHLFCSRQCSMRSTGAKSWKPRPPCVVCGGRLMAGMVRCCSKRCENIRRCQRRPRTCGTCGLSFTQRRIGQKFCSRKCSPQRHATPFVSVTCAQCGRQFQRREAQARKHRLHFCHKICQYKFHRLENHSLWRGGHDHNRGPRWQQRAAEIRERDCHVCQRCGRTEAENGRKLDVDHIMPWRLFVTPDDANDPKNLVSLCKRCHRHKTAVIEHRYLKKGDLLGMQQYRRSIGLPSSVSGGQR